MTPTVNMTICLEKAINGQETAIKEKHIRNIIIGTFQDKGITKFWNFVQQLPLRKNVLLCWKVCHVLHKVLKEGHESVLKDSQQFKHILHEKCQFWTTQSNSSGYGILVKSYCNLLMIKLNFHLRNSRIPGNFDIGDDYLRLCENKNSQLLNEMFDLLEAILILENDVIKSIDTSLSTMIHPNQCKFQPLVVCVQESTIIYSHVTKILFGMHKRISPGLLIGHRERYLRVFLTMKNINFKIQFFMQSLDLDILNLLKNFSIDNSICPSTPLIENPADQNDKSIKIVKKKYPKSSKITLKNY